MVFAERAPGRTIEINGEEYLFFSGTAYLGIPHNETFNHYLTEGLGIYGTNYGSSRNSNFQFKIYEEAEKKLASIAGAEAALTVSSGYLAGQIVVELFTKNSSCFYAPNTHPAIGSQKDEIYEGEFSLWSEEIATKISSSKAPDIVILCNSLDPLYCELYNFDWISALPKNKKISIVIDDSHGLGITGRQGGGIYSVLTVPENINLIVTASLGKACGIPGGVVFSNNKTFQKLKRSPVFSGSSPVNPAYFYSYLKAEKEYEQARQKLIKNIEAFQKKISSLSFLKYIDNFPVFFSKDQMLYQYLLQKKIFISHFPYPSPESDPISRIVLNSLHTGHDIDLLGAIIVEYGDKVNSSKTKKLC